jgi:hypothetical protein
MTLSSGRRCVLRDTRDQLTRDRSESRKVLAVVVGGSDPKAKVASAAMHARAAERIEAHSGNPTFGP